MNSPASSDKVVIIGAGPAGMACAYTLAKNRQPSLVIEKENVVGGLCRTIDFGGYLFDIGGHRFLSKSEEINNLWREILGGNLLEVRRLSRIYYKKRFFKYPLSFFDTFLNLGPIESFRCVMSYFYAKYIKSRDDNTFEGWIINRFGKRLYEIFFDTYTRKVWAVPCEDISADWAAQRIHGLSLRVAIKKSILGSNTKGPKTLSEKFLYPRKGPGEFYDNLKELAGQLGAQFALSNVVTGINHDGRKIMSIEVKRDNGNEEELIPTPYLFSCMPLPLLIKSLIPQPPENILVAASELRLRSFLVVNVILEKEHLFPDQWIYIHSPKVLMGRIQNYKNWSPAMTVDSKKTSLGLEYFCTEGDTLWNMNDVDLINYAIDELEQLGIISRKHLINGFVVRQSNVYPLYSINYQKNIRVIRDYLNQFYNFQTMGRAGLFRYGNSDHALLTGICAAKNFLSRGSCDVWNQCTEEEYLEA